jgi:eukaryotic-like serine/threonine-protein kinase
MTGDTVTVGERYELGDVLGRGGMAEVRSAIDTRLGRPVAVKQLRIDLATDPTFQARFRREAQSAAGLNHPTIVAVYDTGEEPDPATGISVPYIVMELVQGPTLRDVLRDGRKILPERALELTQGVLDALSYSHKAGIIHRDIKPANVMLTPTGGVKVMDFGIARAVADTSATMTQTAAVIGTAQYLSPEQARGETVDSRSDIYSAGCLLYELLVGRPPFIGESPVSVAYQHVREAPVPPSHLDPVITPDIDAITLKALAKDPADRYQSARDMKADISRVLAGQQATAMVPAVESAAATVAGDSTPTRVVRDAEQTRVATPVVMATTTDDLLEEEEEEPRKSRLGLGIFITGLIVLILAAGGYGLYKMLGPTTKAPEKVAVPNVLTYTEAQATEQLMARNLKVTVKHVNDDEDTKGQVTGQNPLPGVEVEVNSTVQITVNDGPKTGKIPTGLKGKSLDAVTKALDKAKFTNVVTEPAAKDPTDAKPNEVVSISPPAGSTIALDDKITVKYATGKSKVPVMTGKTPAQAESDARAVGFSKFKRIEEPSSETAGVVFAQDPAAGTIVSRATTITYRVAIPKPSPTPTDTQSEPPSPTPSGSTSGG